MNNSVINVAIIPARGGSKRIPKKNIKLFAGKPLIAYSIEAAKASELFDRVIVSTDSAEIANVAKRVGAEVPFMRPSELSDDYTPTIQVLNHAINWLRENSVRVRYFCCIYSNPFVTINNITKAYEMLKEKNATSVLAVTSFPFPIFRGIRINDSGRVEAIFPDKFWSRSQDLPEAYHDTGQFYWWDCEAFLAAKDIKDLPLTNRHPLVIPRHQVQDIDTPEDWEVAEKMYTAFFQDSK